MSTGRSGTVAFRTQVLGGCHKGDNTPAITNSSFAGSIHLAKGAGPVTNISSVRPNRLAIGSGSRTSRNAHLPAVSGRIRTAQAPIGYTAAACAGAIPAFRRNSQIYFGLHIGFPGVSAGGTIIASFLPPSDRCVTTDAIPKSTGALAPPPKRPACASSTKPLA